MPTHRDYVKISFDQFWDKIKEKFQSKNSILDVGCYDDHFKTWFEQKGLYWHGVDTKPACEGVKQADMCNIPCPENFFDILFVCHALEHTTTPYHALKEFLRVLKPGGYVFIATPSVCEKQITLGDPDHYFVLNPMQWRKLMDCAGFVEIEGFVQSVGIPREHDYNVIMWGKKA